MKESVMEMYIEAARRLDAARVEAENTEPGSEERDRFEQIYGERLAYSRILKELHGVETKELQAILDAIYEEGRA